jgi:ribosome biogenesis GTPase
LTGSTSKRSGVVRCVHAKTCEVVPEGESDSIVCSVRGRLHRIGRERSPLAAGDRVAFVGDASGAVVESILPRVSRFSREPAHPGGRPQVLAANVDLVIALLSAANPAPVPRLADRVLAAAASEAVDSRVLISKVDLADPAVVEDLEALYRKAGVGVLRVASPSGEGLDEVRALMTGRTSVLAGPSGAGKTTLLRALLGASADHLRIGEVNARTGKGRHTTTSAVLLPFPGGGWVVDTPGVRTLALREMTAPDLGRLYSDIAREGDCRFLDCSHTVEPGCAAERAVREGRMDLRRLESFRALLATQREAEERRGY